MRIRLPKSIGASVAIMTMLVCLQPTEVTVVGRALAAAAEAQAAPALKTPWGEPDLQGIWTVESDTPLQRSAKYTNQEFFTETQREELDQERLALLGRDKRVERGT